MCTHFINKRDQRALLLDASAPKPASTSPNKVYGATHRIWPMSSLEGSDTSGFSRSRDGKELRKRSLSAARVSPRPTRYLRAALVCRYMRVKATNSTHKLPTTKRLLSVKMRSGSTSSVFMLNRRRQFESPAYICAMYCRVSPLALQYLREQG